MPFTPAKFPADAVFTIGRRVRLSDEPYGTRSIGERERTERALRFSGYAGDASQVTLLCDETTSSVVVPASTAGVVVDALPGKANVLFVWRAPDGKVYATLALGAPTTAFVTQRGRPRLPGEPMPGAVAAPAAATGDVQSPVTVANNAKDTAKAATSQPDVADALETLRQALQPKATVDEAAVRAIVEEMLQSPKAQAARARLTVAQASSSNPIMAALQSRYTPTQEAPANLLLAAPPSLGKSYAVREFAKQYDVYLEHGCTDDIDEVATLLGGPVPDGNGGFLVVDGVLTQAVRAASQGQTVLLLLDEVLRLGERPQEWLLSFLTGVKAPAGRVYRLRTRKADNGALEVIECPTTHLHLVAAANLGARHPQEAFWSRWDVVRFGFDQATVEGIAETVATSYGIANAPMLAKRFTGAVILSRAGVAANTLKYPMDIRTLERACQLTATPDAQAVCEYLATRVADVCAHWSVDLGETDIESKPSCDAIANILTGSI